jgi:hypothetical protein
MTKLESCANNALDVHSRIAVAIPRRLRMGIVVSFLFLESRAHHEYMARPSRETEAERGPAGARAR